MLIGGGKKIAWAFLNKAHKEDYIISFFIRFRRNILVSPSRVFILLFSVSAKIFSKRAFGISYYNRKRTTSGAELSFFSSLDDFIKTRW